jgi:hypothetical protein
VLLDKFRTLYNGKRRTNFDDSGDLSDDAYHTLTRLSKDEFHHLVKEFSNSNIQNSCHRSIRTVVGIYLCKLRQGLSNSLLAIIFEMPDKRVVSRTINSARKAIMEHFIPYNLGFGHVTRQGIIDRHTKTFTEGLMCGDDTVILVIDDTYIYIYIYSSKKIFICYNPQSSVTFSEVPKQFVSTNGYIVACIEPFFFRFLKQRRLHHE